MSEEGGGKKEDERVVEAEEDPQPQVQGKARRKAKGGGGKEVHECPSCGRDSTLSNEGTVLLNFAQQTIDNGEPPPEPEKSRKGLASKDAHAVLPQSMLRPAVQASVSVFCAMNGRKGDDAEFLLEQWDAFKKFYVAQMKSLVMRPPGKPEDGAFTNSMEEAALRLPGDVPVDYIRDRQRELLALEPGKSPLDLESGALAELLGGVPSLRPPPLTVTAVEGSVEAILLSPDLDDQPVSQLSQGCEQAEQNVSDASVSSGSSLGGAMGKQGAEVDLLAGIGARMSSQQEDKLRRIARTAVDRKIDVRNQGDLLEVSWTAAEDPPCRVTQCLAPDGVVLAHTKMTEQGPVNMLTASDLAQIEGSLGKTPTWVGGLFKGIMGAPFTVGKQCAYCEKVQGELTFPDRVRLAEKNGLTGEARDAFVSKTLLERMNKVKLPGGSEITIVEKMPSEVAMSSSLSSPFYASSSSSTPSVEEKLDAFMQQWLETVAEDALKGRIANAAKEQKRIREVMQMAASATTVEEEDDGGFGFGFGFGDPDDAVQEEEADVEQQVEDEDAVLEKQDEGSK